MAPSAVVTTSSQERALDAAVELVARWGVTKTTLGDVARAAAMSRATLYRCFPGGKDELFDLLAQREVARLLGAVADAVDAAGDLPTALAAGLHAAARAFDGHAALRFVLDHEPDLATAVLGFAEMDRLLRVVRRALAPHLVRFLDAPDAGWAAEWLARVFLSALVSPTPAFHLADPEVCHRLVRRYLAPAFAARSTAPVDRGTVPSHAASPPVPIH
ncbi:helix-turn-helix domain-containing protein [Iamia sp.]|uniref:TetR/AcrR family transcriptional regulator n=1 Tax=Iamia sp. TaxID=2722710 RepID=UPI002CFF5D7E|nr:helix-turn-helix domain-containing protein [Iamia sp.]HXH56921.1 helix-turn-helix domain-containing protein [Iamia sp.]